MGLVDLLHEIVNHLPIHDKAKSDLHEKVDGVSELQPEQAEEA